MGNCKLSDNAYDVLSLDESVKLLKKSFWQRMTEPLPEPDKNDCDNRVNRATMRAIDRHTGKRQPAIGYVSGLIDGFHHAVNLIVTPKEIWFWDDGCNQVLLPGNEVYFIWL
jgi:hypothetical protein